MWLGLTTQLIKTKVLKPVATVKGRLDRQRKNIGSTQHSPNEADTENKPPSDIPDDRSHRLIP
jgi:hypothetical protein